MIKKVQADCSIEKTSETGSHSQNVTFAELKTQSMAFRILAVLWLALKIKKIVGIQVITGPIVVGHDA